MVNAEIRTLVEPDGTPVCNVAFDLSADQLRSAALAIAAVRVERHRGAELETDDVLALRELTGVCDELDRLSDAGGHGTVILPLGRLVALHDALGEWTTGRTDRGWMREDEHEAFPVVHAMLTPLATVRADALQTVLGSTADAPGA